MTCKDCFHYKACSTTCIYNIGKPLEGDTTACDLFIDKSAIMVFPFIAMIEQHLINGKFVNSNIQNKNGMYTVVYMDKNKCRIPLIDVCGKSPYNGEECEARLKELQDDRT